MPPKPTLHDPGDQFVERNLFLHVALGIVSLSRQLEARLVEEAATGAAWRPSPHLVEAPCTYFVLGLLSSSRRAMAYLEAARERSEVTPTAPKGEAPPSGPYLRSLLD